MKLLSTNLTLPLRRYGSSVSEWYEVPGEDSPLTTFTQPPEQNPQLTVVTAPPVNATNSFYENDISLDPLDVILQLQVQVGPGLNELSSVFSVISWIIDFSYITNDKCLSVQCRVFYLDVAGGSDDWQ